MLPLLPFAAGLITGAVALKFLNKTRNGKLLEAQLDRARNTLRTATVSSLEKIEHSSASLRERLADAPQAQADSLDTPPEQPGSSKMADPS